VTVTQTPRGFDVYARPGSSHTASVAATAVTEQLALAERTAGLDECQQRVLRGPRLFLPDCRAEAGPASK
jgi:hypothetical protein